MTMKTLGGLLLWMGLCAAAVAQNRYRTLQPADMEHDLALLHKALTSLHPGLYRYQTPEQLDLRFAAARLKCRQPLDDRRFYILLSQLAAEMHSSATYLNPYSLPDSTARRLLPERVVPVFFRVVEGSHIVVTHGLCTEPELKRGDEILAVNGIAARTIIDSLLSVSPADGLHAEGRRLYNLNEPPEQGRVHTLFDVYYPFFFGYEKDFLLTIKPLKGKTFTRRAEGLTLDQRQKVYEARCGRLPDPETGWAYRLLDGQTAYLKCGIFGAVSNRARPAKFIDSVFADLAQHPQVTGLVIDIRGNSGDNEALAFRVQDYAAPRLPGAGMDFGTMTVGKEITLSDSLRPYIINAKELTTSTASGADASEAKGSSPIVPANRFKGKVALLTDAGTANAAFKLAQDMKAQKAAVLVGEATGGNLQGISGGRTAHLRLPHSGMEVDIPLEQVLYDMPAATARPDEGIRPDKEVRFSLDDVKQDRDPQLSQAARAVAK